jgi:hypothetical protein
MSQDLESKLEQELFPDGQQEEEVEQVQEESQPEEVSKIKVGEEEYTQEELSRLVGLGKIGLEAEEKFNTKIDKVWPEYTKSQNEIKRLKQLEEEYETIRQNKSAEPEDVEKAYQEAREAARKLGLITVDDFRDLYYKEEAAKDLVSRGRELEKTFDGSDGRPKFDVEDMFNYMAQNHIQDPELAYKIRFESELDSWKETQLAKGKKPGLTTNTQSAAGTKAPPNVKPNRDNLDELIREQLYGGQ